jgi:hypothetical protein
MQAQRVKVGDAAGKAPRLASRNPSAVSNNARTEAELHLHADTTVTLGRMQIDQDAVKPSSSLARQL